MAAHRWAIVACVEDPDAIRLSKESAQALVHEKSIDNLAPENLVRVIVRYNGTDFLTGLLSGVVVTAFPVNSMKYGGSRVGRYIYRRTS